MLNYISVRHKLIKFHQKKSKGIKIRSLVSFLKSILVFGCKIFRKFMFYLLNFLVIFVFKAGNIICS